MNNANTQHDALPLTADQVAEVKGLFEREVNRKVADGWDVDDALERAAQIAGEQAHIWANTETEAEFEVVDGWIEQLIANH